MDFRAIAELIWFSFLGLAVLGATAAISIRVFLAPVIREVMDRLGGERSEEQARLAAHLEMVESRLADTERELRRIQAAEEFDRKLQAGADEPAGGPAGAREPGRPS